MTRNKPPTRAVQPEEVQASSVLGLGLSLKQSRFLTALLSSEKFDPTAAAISAGCSEEQAPIWGKLMLESKPVREGLQLQVGALIEGAQATPARWLQEIARLAMNEPDLSKFYQPDGSIKPAHEWTPEMASYVAGWEVEELWTGRGEQRQFLGHVKRIKLHPVQRIRLQALEMLAKYHKLYADLTVKIEDHKRIDVTVEHKLTLEEASRLYMDMVRSDASAADVRH